MIAFLTKFNRVVPIFFLCALSATTLAHDEGWRLGNGTTVGAVLGGVIGYQVDRQDGAVVGSILGAIAGSRHHHSSRHNPEARFFNYNEEQRIRERVTRRIATETQQFTLSGETLFEPGTSKLTSQASAELSPISSLLQGYDRTLVHISGYSGSASDTYRNKVLALGRAESVAQYLVLQGIPRARIQTTGSGAEISDRVDVFVEPIFSAVDR